MVSLYNATGTLLGTGLVDGSGNWSITPLSPLPEGTNNLSITQTDLAGNISSSVPFSVDIDSIAPLAPTLTSA